MPENFPSLKTEFFGAMLIAGILATVTLAAFFWFKPYLPGTAGALLLFAWVFIFGGWCLTALLSRWLEARDHSRGM
jgi:hypothetical protein